MVIVEYCRYGNLRSYLLKHKQTFNPTLANLAEEEQKMVKLGATVDLSESI